MSSGRGRSPCDTGPRELRLDVICPGTLAAASRRNDGSGQARQAAGCPRMRVHIRLGACPQGAVLGHARLPAIPRGQEEQ